MYVYTCIDFNLGHVQNHQSQDQGHAREKEREDITKVKEESKSV